MTFVRVGKTGKGRKTETETREHRGSRYANEEAILEEDVPASGTPVTGTPADATPAKFFLNS